MKRFLSQAFLFVFLIFPSCVQNSSRTASPRTESPIKGVPVKTIQVEHLPDLNIPRSAHSIAAVGDELLVFGGNTTGFTLTKTAEYYSKGQWHLIPMLYNHASSFATRLSSGDILLGGGCSEDFGIGQSWGVERYIPGEHRFESLPILDRKRAICHAAELPDGTLLVSGNWYAEDALELYTPGGNFQHIKFPAEQRSAPYILPTTEDNAVVFAPTDPYNHPTGLILDRLHGEPFTVPLFEEYRPLPLGDSFYTPDHFFIGNQTNGDYSYLIPVQRDSSEIRLALLRGEHFSLLETEQPIPLCFDATYPSFVPLHRFFVDRDAQQVWIYMSYPDCVYLLRIDYRAALDGGKAGLTLYRTEPLNIGLQPAIRLPDGRFLLAGGGPNSPQHYFEPIDTVLLLTPEDTAAAHAPAGWQIGLLILLGAGVAGLLGYTLSRRRRSTRKHEAANAPGPMAEDKVRELIDRIDALMEGEELFRQQNLKILDVAKRLGTNVTYISSCINNSHGGSFNDFVNRYRVDYAKQWLLDHPDKKISEVIEESGFASEASFFRNFKTLTGQTPSEWLAGEKQMSTKN